MSAGPTPGEPAALTDITDGLPVDPVHRSPDGTKPADAPAVAVQTELLPDEGVAQQVARRADEGAVPVIIRLREQVDLEALTAEARAAAVEAAVETRTALAERDLTRQQENGRTATAAEDARSRTVVDALRGFAADRRPPVAEVLGDLRGDGHVTDVAAYWIFSGFSATVDRTALAALGQHPDVASVTLDATIEAPEVDPESRPKLPTWGLETVRATDVWSEYADRGDGVVVGIMDGGVDGSHPALSGSWRGRTGDPAKSWFVATNEDYPTPGDGGGHGTHVAGSIVGGPPGEVVGVAPEATWIAAKIFNDFGSASTSGIHASFQWMLAPGGDPTARPDVVNNSWGSAATYSTEFWPDVDSWRAAGIVPLFANGNDGPGPTTVGSPGSFPHSFAVGATDVNDVVAGFSSRGPVSWDGVAQTKPEIAAPGHHIVSSFPAALGYGEYVDLSGTSMATPHVAGVTALLLSANPGLTVDQVESVLSGTARQEPFMGDLPDNDYGHGIVDAFAAVTKASRSGTVSGTVTGPAGPVTARLVVEGAPWTATTSTESGQFQVTVPAGRQTIRVSAPGLRTVEIDVTIESGESRLRDIRLRAAGSATLRGEVTEGRDPIEGAEVTVVDSGVQPVFTDADGDFRTTVPGGEYVVRVRAAGYAPWSTTVRADRNRRLHVRLERLGTGGADGWSQYQNDPTHSGHTTDAVAPATLRREWTIDTGPGITFSSPVVADGTVYVGTVDGELEARDLDTGELLWSHDVGDELRGSPAVADGAVVVGGGLDGGFTALDAATGEVLWEVETPGLLTVYTQPTIIDGVVYANTGPSAADDTLYALDLDTGAVRWQTPVAAGVFTGPAADDDTLYLTSADERSVTAVDRATGAIRWTTTRPGESFYSAPSVADGLVYATTTSDATWDGALIALRADDGSLAWEQVDHGDAQGSSPAVYGDLVITGTHASGAVVAYDRRTGEVAWRHQDSGPVSASVMTTGDGYVIAGSQIDSAVFALDAATGQRVWRDDVAANVTSSGAYDDGTYVTADTSGQLYAYRTTGTVRGTVRGPSGPVDGTVELVGAGASVRTDPETGAYSLDHRPGSYELRVTAYGYAAQTLPVTVVAGRAVTVDVTLAAVGDGTLTGTVLDPDGTPVEGATVAVRGTPLDPVTTGPDGAFAFARVAAGDHRLDVDKQGFVPSSTPVTVTAGAATELDVTLERYQVAVMGDYQGLMTATLERLGYAADETTYAEVTAEPGSYDVVVANGADDRPPAGTIRPFVDATDAAGTSVIWLDQWSIGYGSILQLSEQTGDPTGVVTASGGTGDVSLIPTVEHPLTEGLALGTRVPVLAHDSDWAAFTGYSGITVAGLHVDARGDVGGGIGYQPRSLDSTHVLLSTFAAAPWGRPGQDWLPAVEDIIGNAVGYALDAAYGGVSGTVTDASGVPAADVSVSAVGTDVRTRTDATGGYQLLLDPGTHTLRFRSPGAATQQRAVTVVAGEEQDLDVALAPAERGTVSGTVTGDAGAPVAGASVRLPEVEGAQTTTAADGTYALGDVPAEDYLLEVTADGYLPATRQVTVVGGETTRVDVALRGAPRVGVVGDFNNLVAGLLQSAGMTTTALDWTSTGVVPSLDVVVFNDPPTPTAARFDAFLAAMDAHGVSGVFADGYFSSDGGVRLLRQLTGNPSEPRTQFDDVGDIHFTARDPRHAVFEGLGPDPQVLVADSYSTTIPGYTGFPVADATSEERGDEGIAVTYQPRTPSSVHLLLGGMSVDLLMRPADDWTADGRRLYTNAVLFAAQPALGTLTGEVTGVDDAPVAGTVSIEGTEQRVAVADDGGYAVNLPPGTYTARYAGFGYTQQTREITIEAGATLTRDVGLAPRDDVGTVAGVVTSGGQPVAGATVRLRGVPRQATTAADGSYALVLVEPGDYELDLTGAGYLRHRDTVTVVPAAATAYDAELRVTARVGVVDDYQGKVAAWLAHWGYTPQPLTWANTAAVADLDLVVANLGSSSGFDPGRTGLQEFDEAALRAGISVVWLDQFGRGSFRYLTGYTGDPAGNGEDRSDGPVTATPTATGHPIAAGLPASFPLVAEDNEYSWFEDFDGRTLATVSSDTLDGGGLVGERPRGAAGVDILVGTLSMSSYGFAAYDAVTGEAWTLAAERLLRNAVRYALDAPASGGQVEGTLTGAEGPLPGTVTVVETGRVHDVGADGRFLVGLPPGTWTLRGEATNHEPAEEIVEVAVGDALTRDLALELRPAGDVTGTITDGAGAPVPGPAVRVEGTEFTATTDAAGRYLVEGVPAGDYALAASGPGWQTSRVSVTVVADEAVTADLTVGPSVPVALVGDYLGSVGGLLEGDGYTVTDYGVADLGALAEAVADYDVVVMNRGATSSGLADFGALLGAAAEAGVSVVLAAQWGGDAIRSLRDLRGDPATVEWSFVPGSVSYIPRSRHPIFAGFEPGQPVRILDDPAGGNQQYATFADYTGALLARTRADGDGTDLGGGVGVRYTSAGSAEILLGSLAAGTYGRPGREWTAAAERIYLQAVAFAATATRGEVAGTVTAGGEPVAGAAVTASGADLPDQTVTTDAAGRYAVGLPDGTWTVTVRASGYATASRDVTVTGTTVTADFVLEVLPRGTLSGTVTGGDDDPIVGATLEGVGPTTWPATTGAGGGWTAEDLLDGDYTVTVSAPGYLTEVVTTRFTGPAMVLDVELTGIDVGVLGDADGALVAWLRSEDVAAGPVSWSTSMDLTGYQVVVVNGDGGSAVTRAEFDELEDEAADSGTGLVWTGTWGSEGGLRVLERHDRVVVGEDGYGDGAVRLTDLAKRHRLFDGLSAPATVLAEDSYWSTIEDYDGKTLATQRVTLADGSEDRGIGAAWDWVSRRDVEVLLASMAVTGAIGPDQGWTASGERLFLNAVALARDPGRR